MFVCVCVCVMVGGGDGGSRPENQCDLEMLFANSWISVSISIA